jgi:hypothetical protein
MNFILDIHISPNISQLFLSEFTIFVVKQSLMNLIFLAPFSVLQFVMLLSASHPKENLAKFSYK